MTGLVIPRRWVSLDALKRMAEARADYKCPNCGLALNEDESRELPFCWCGFADSKTAFITARRIVVAKAK